MRRFCEYDNETSGFIKGVEFLEKVSENHFRKDSDAAGQLLRHKILIMGVFE